MPGMSGPHHVPGAGPTMGGALPGQQGQPHMGSPQRLGTGVQQTPILPPNSGGVRPQSRLGEQPMLSFPGQQPQYGTPMRAAQPPMGQHGQPFGGQGMSGMPPGDRPGPQQNAMQSLANSPPGARPASATGGPVPNGGGVNVMLTPNMANMAARGPNGVPAPGGTGFPTPAQQLAAQEARGGLAGGPLHGGVSMNRGQPPRPPSRAMPPPTGYQFVPGGGPGAGPGPGAPQPGGVIRQGTPMQPPHPRPPTGPPTPAHPGQPHVGMPQHGMGPQQGAQSVPPHQQPQQPHAPPALTQANAVPQHAQRPPSRTPSRQQSQQPQASHPQPGRSHTPRTPQANLPTTPGTGPGPSAPQPPMGAITGRPHPGPMPAGPMGGQMVQHPHPPAAGPSGGPPPPHSIPTPSPTVQHALNPQMRVPQYVAFS